MFPIHSGIKNGNDDLIVSGEQIPRGRSVDLQESPLFGIAGVGGGCMAGINVVGLSGLDAFEFAEFDDGLDYIGIGGDDDGVKSAQC